MQGVGRMTLEAYRRPSRWSTMSGDTDFWMFAQGLRRVGARARAMGIPGGEGSKPGQIVPGSRRARKKVMSWVFGCPSRSAGGRHLRVCDLTHAESHRDLGRSFRNVLKLLACVRVLGDSGRSESNLSL